LAGLLPFIGGAAALWLADATWAPRVGLALAAYAATIAAFLGGIHWGHALREQTHDRVPLLWGVMPQLLGWLALLLPLRSSLAALGLLLAICYVADRRLYARAGLGRWLPLRLKLTLGAVVSCGIGAAAV
jgi:hypothetical protein